MMPGMNHPCAVVAAGTGSDEVFVRSAFERPLADVGVRLHAPRPEPLRLADAALAAFDAAAADGPVIAGGVSLGAHLAATWALRNPSRCAGLLLALPAWNGPADDAPAAVAARRSAELIVEHGIEAALDIATEGVPAWLDAELRRAWSRQGSALAAGLTAASRYPAPELTALSTVDVPTGIATCTDDPVHPSEVAYAWADAIDGAAVVETTLADVGADRTALGRAAWQAYQLSCGSGGA